MKFMYRYLCLLISCFTISLLPFSSFAETTAQALPSLAPVLKNAMPAIVNIAVQGIIQTPITPPDDEDNDKNPPENQQLLPERAKKFQSIGSGVIIDPNNGIIITNDHVIRNANLITVTLNDGRRLKARLIGSDSDTDLAVLKIDAKNLKSLPIGDSDKAEVGDFVVAIGNPFGLNSFG